MSLIIPSLALMGVKRATPADVPDLITVYKTPYPVLANYKKLMNEMGMEPYAGGTHITQGSMQPGYITSGYRTEKPYSPHGFAVALDIAIGDIHAQVRAGVKACLYFDRVGLYPFNGIIHVDLFDAAIMDYYRKAQFWVRDKNMKYHYFNTYEGACDFGLKIAA